GLTGPSQDEPVGVPESAEQQRSRDVVGQAMAGDLAQHAVEVDDRSVTDRAADDAVGAMVMYVTVLIALAIGVGTLIVNALADVGITIPAYLGPMLVAAVLRNLIDWRGYGLP